MCSLSPLAKCNRCEGLFIDHNPKTDQQEFDTRQYDIKGELELMKDGKEFYWGCPTCQTDGFLVDFETEEKPA